MPEAGTQNLPPDIRESQPSLVSIIMPNRNHAKYLPRALDGIRAQTWPHWELIVIDDASSDSSIEVLARYAALDPRIGFTALERHGGIAFAVNAGLEKAHGEFLYFAASDDFVAATFIERSVIELKRHPEAGLSFSDPTECYEDGSPPAYFPLYLSKRPKYFDAATLTDTFRSNYFHISTNTSIYRSAAFRSEGGFRADLQSLMDWFPTTVIALRYGACYLPESLTYLTVNAVSYSARNLRDKKTQRRVFAHMLVLLAMPEYADVAARLQRAVLLPEYRPRTLLWLLRSEIGRQFIGPRLIMRVICRYSWSFMRPLAPVAWRRSLRRLQNGLTMLASETRQEPRPKSVERIR